MIGTNLELAEMIAQNSGDIQGIITQLIEEVRELRTERDERIRDVDIFASLSKFYDDVHAANVRAGWWTDIASGQPKKRNVGEMLVLIVTELSEAYRAYVNGDFDDKLPLFPGLGVELGDVQIRLADFAGALRAGRVVGVSQALNPGESYFRRIAAIADEYETIRKTPQAVGHQETGDPLPPMDVVPMIVAKLAFNANREDHKIENRLKDDGKRT